MSVVTEITMFRKVKITLNGISKTLKVIKWKYFTQLNINGFLRLGYCEKLEFLMKAL